MTLIRIEPLFLSESSRIKDIFKILVIEGEHVGVGCCIFSKSVGSLRIWLYTGRVMAPAAPVHTQWVPGLFQGQIRRNVKLTIDL